MAETLPSLTGDLKQISECWLYRDPRVSRRARLHTFCLECKDTSPITKDDSCPLCRSFFEIPEEGCGSIPRNYFMEKLVDLHQDYPEKKLNLKGEKILAIPLIEQINAYGSGDGFAQMSWLENKIYVLYPRSTTIWVFSDQAPSGELLEAIQIPGLGEILSMTASTVCRSIFISDDFGYIYRIQMPIGKISQWESQSLDGESGLTTRMSISIASGDCLVTSFLYQLYIDTIQFELQVLSILDGDLNKHSSIPLSTGIKFVGDVAHSPEKNFVISYSNSYPATQFRISIISDDGEWLIRTFNPDSGSVLKNPSVLPFGIDHNGNLFVADFNGDKVIYLNLNFTEYRIMLSKDRDIKSPFSVVYIPEKRRLLVQERRGPIGFEHYRMSVFHLSPCNLARERTLE